MTYNVQEQEEIDFGRGPALWDATPGVCCAAFQLGACEHTESYDEPEPLFPRANRSRDELVREAHGVSAIIPRLVPTWRWNDSEPF